MADLKLDEPTRGAPAPGGVEPFGLRWWLAIAFEAAVVVPMGFLLLMMVAWGWTGWLELVAAGVVFSIAVLVPALLGGVRRWWLLVPIGVMLVYVGILSAVRQFELSPWLILGGLWLSMVAGTGAGRVLQRRLRNG